MQVSSRTGSAPTVKQHLAAILLIAGHKTDSERFYRDYVPRADAISDEYLREIEDERRRAVARGGPKR